MENAVALVLVLLQSDEFGLDRARILQLRQGRGEVLDGLDEDAALLERVLRGRLHTVEVEKVARFVDVVDDVV